MNMAQKQLQQQLKELGSKLETPLSNKDALLKLLKQASTILSELDQSPSASILESMQPFLKAIVKPELLKHQDKDVKLLVATCLCETTRITAPEAPYSDDILKDAFELIVSSFTGLNETSGPSFGRRVIMLETLARYRSCVMMLDLECDDLVCEMLRTFLAVVRDDHPDNVLTSMKTIMIALFEESEEIHEDLLLILLSTLGQNNKGITKNATKLAMNVIEHCAAQLEPAIKEFLISSISGNRKSSSSIDFQEVIFYLYRCSPPILSGIIPYLTGELLTDQSETRLKAIKLLGELFALPGCEISEVFQPIFSEFLKRLTDRVVEIRMSVLEYLKRCLLSNPCRPEAPHIFAALHDRLLDYDENVRKQVVSVVCEVACSDLYSVPVESIKLVAERLRDKSFLVKRYTIYQLAEMYRLFCLRSSDISRTKYGWIPGKLLRCFYDKDFRSDPIESVLCESMFPAEFSVKDRVKQWIWIFSGLDKIEVKALEKILEQKQRLQQEMHKYLSFKQASKGGDIPDFEKKLMVFFRVMSRCFTDPAKAEEGFQALDQLKDPKVWKIISDLLEPNTTFRHACSSRDELLKILGEKDRLFDFLSVLSIKCTYMLFSKEHVKEILAEAAAHRSAADTQYTLSCMNMLVILARYSPLLLIGSQKDLLHLLNKDDEIIKEGILHVLARAGGTIREQLSSSSSPVDLVLERSCVEGTRRQAKYAVHALAAITKDDGLLALSVLYKRLVDMLAERTHLPTVLQSLGCIAQTAMAVFETRESEIVEFIKSSILQCSNKVGSKKKARWRDQSEACQLKIFAIKTLVKSYLPVKDAHLRAGIDDLIVILRNMLSFGEISKEIQSSSVDKAHLRLASAKAVLRLSRYWDHKIPTDVFHLTLRTVEINFPQARTLFLHKIHQYVKDRVLDAKYACAFLLNIFRSKHGRIEEDKQNFNDIIQMCRQVRARQLSMQPDVASPMPYPEYILPYFVHALAHHRSCPDVDECKDVKEYEPIYRLLYLFLSMVLRGDNDSSDEAHNNEKESASAIISLFKSIKHSEDVIDVTKSKTTYAICEMGLSIVKRLTQKPDDLEHSNTTVSLPPMFFKPNDKKEEEDVVVGETNTWLTDDSVLAHFESLKLEVSGTVLSETADDEVLLDSERDGNEEPLGKLIKHIKSQKTKGKKVGGKNSPSSEKKSAGHDVDILGVVREINLDSMGISSNFESSNGHENLLGGKTKDNEENQKKKRKVGDLTPSPVPKRRRSSYTKVSKYSSPRNPVPSVVKGQVPVVEPRKLGLLVSRTYKRDGGKGSDQGNDEMGHKSDGSDANGKKKPVLLEKADNDDIGSNAGSPVSSNKKRRRRSIVGLSKCSSKGGTHTTDLVDCRIKVWWPLDKQYYEGVVKSYDPEKGKHVVLYDDGDVEVLRLTKERWEPISDSGKLNKISTASKSPSKRTPSRKKAKVSEASGQKKSEKRIKSSSVKGKRTQRKDSKRRTKKVVASPEGENESDLSNPGPTVSSEVDEPASGDLEKELVGNEHEGMSFSKEDKSESEASQGEDSDAKEREDKEKPECEANDREGNGESDDEAREEEKEKSECEAREGGDGEEADASVKPEENEKPSPESREHLEVEGSPEASSQDSHSSDRTDDKMGGTSEEVAKEDHGDEAISEAHRQNESNVLESGGSDDADDKPLCTWMRHAGKSKRGK